LLTGVTIFMCAG